MGSTWKPDPSEPLAEADIGDWKALALSHISKLRGGNGASKNIFKQPQKLERIAAYRHLIALDSVLQLILGEGKGFRVFLPCGGAGGSLPLAQKPCLVLQEDRHSVNMSGAFYLLYRSGARMMWLPDELHNLWSSIGTGASRAGWGYILRLTEICMNLNYGPWGGQRFFMEICEMTAKYAETLGTEGPLVRHYLENIRQDLGCSSERSEHNGSDLAGAQRRHLSSKKKVLM